MHPASRIRSKRQYTHGTVIMSHHRAKKANQAKFSSGHISYTTEIADFLGQLYDKEEAVIVRGYEKIRQYKAKRLANKGLKNPILGEGNPTPRELRIANKKRRPRDTNNIFIADDIDQELERMNRTTGRLENSNSEDRRHLAESNRAMSTSRSSVTSTQSLDSFRSFKSDNSDVSLSDLVHLERLKKNLEKRLEKVNNKILDKINDVNVESRHRSGRLSRATIRSARS